MRRVPGLSAEYHRKIDEVRGYPEEFVVALTKAGWMVALMPEEYGGYEFACEYDVARSSARPALYQAVPVSTNLIQPDVTEHILGLLCSF